MSDQHGTGGLAHDLSANTAKQRLDPAEATRPHYTQVGMLRLDGPQDRVGGRPFEQVRLWREVGDRCCGRCQQLFARGDARAELFVQIGGAEGRRDWLESMHENQAGFEGARKPRRKVERLHRFRRAIQRGDDGTRGAILHYRFRQPVNPYSKRSEVDDRV